MRQGAPPSPVPPALYPLLAWWSLIVELTCLDPEHHPSTGRNRRLANTPPPE
ncbi:hypothetical protein ACIRS3_34725 [Streptomyces virginiae]|uniref:hypothetical protein n=1 Tax=Streptomyces virginiae TaxID=1961 RepID=UPI003816E3A7